MKLFLALLLATLNIGSAAAATSNPVATENVKARLVSEQDRVAPGKPFWVALAFDIRDGWHTYWRNPGDSGQATRIEWDLPPGASASQIFWARPHRFELPPLVNYGYAKHAVHLVEITAPAGNAGTLRLHAKAHWLVCADICVPEDGEFDLTLAVGEAHADAASAKLFAAARADLPLSAPGAITASSARGELALGFDAAWRKALANAKHVEFFPEDTGAIAAASPPVLARDGGDTRLTLKVGDSPPTGPRLRGVLVADSAAYAIDASLPLAAGAAAPTPPAALASTTLPAAPPVASTPLSGSSVAGFMLLAVLGGLILNLMPCVFPVLSIKAMGLVEQSKKHPQVVRRKGLVFAAGVIGSMLTLATILLALRAGGEQIGWGFQLQSPVFVTMMIYLLFAVGLNLSGVFEVGGSLAGVGDTLTQGDSYRASFFTGVLTTLVATPCTAPFMGAAVGAALSQPAYVALAIFFALGVGLSLPYLLLSFAPWLRRSLPRPGAWMDTLKQLFAFPMYASAAWLLWVLAQQTSASALAAALAGAVLIGFAAWGYQKSKTSTGGSRWIILGITAMAVIVALGLPLQLASGATPVKSQSGTAADGEWRPYVPAEVASLVASGRPVLVNFTADWCLTCLVNERNAFGDAGVQKLFHDKGVVLVKGDWTNRNQEITQALAQFGRAGVPLYVLYNAKLGASEPIVLPQLLTPSIVSDALASIPSI